MTDLSFVKECLTVDFERGLLFWKIRPVEHFPCERSCKSWNTRYAGKEALCSVQINGYKAGRLNGTYYAVHRLIFALKFGFWPEQVDHINGIRTDNRLVNLRSVTSSVNAVNKCVSSLNTSGVTGVTWDKQTNKWRAKIKRFGKHKSLGRFGSFEEAVKCRKEAEKLLGFHENHGRPS